MTLEELYQQSHTRRDRPLMYRWSIGYKYQDQEIRSMWKDRSRIVNGIQYITIRFTDGSSMTLEPTAEISHV